MHSETAMPRRQNSSSTKHSEKQQMQQRIKRHAVQNISHCLFCQKKSCLKNLPVLKSFNLERSSMTNQIKIFRLNSESYNSQKRRMYPIGRFSM